MAPGRPCGSGKGFKICLALPTSIGPRLLRTFAATDPFPCARPELIATVTADKT